MTGNAQDDAFTGPGRFDLNLQTPVLNITQSMRMMHLDRPIVSTACLADACMSVLIGAAALETAAHAQAAASDFTTGYRYDTQRRVTGTISPDPDGGGALHYLAMRNTYNASGRLTKVETGELASWQSDTVKPSAWSGFTVFRTVDSYYDNSDRKIRETVTAGGAVQALVQMSYNYLDKVVCTAARMNPAAFSSPPSDACALGSQGTGVNDFGPDRITKNIYASGGYSDGYWLLQVRKGVGTPLEQAYVTYDYTPNLKQKYVVDANGNKARFDYDGFDRLSAWVFPSTTRPGAFNGSTPANALATAGSENGADYEAYNYDAANNRTYFRKRDGNVITFGYDALNRMLSKGGSSIADVAYTYDLVGHQLTAKFATAGLGVTNAFDGAGRLTSSSTNMGGTARTLSYQYDADGNRTRITFPGIGDYWTYDYDGLDRVVTLWQSGTTPVDVFAYDNAGRRIIQATYTSSTRYGYDAASRLSSRAFDFPVSPSSALNVTYGYNPASQMTSRISDNDTYAFTAAYNVNRTYSSNGLNQYSQIASSSTINPTYDGNGNLTSAGGSTYSYDVENRLVSASGANNVTLSYDPLGRLFQTSGGFSGTTQYLYDGDALVAEYDGSGNMLRRYIHGPGVDEPLLWYEGSGLGTRRNLYANHQGSIVAVLDSNGTTLQVNAYDPDGIPMPNNLGRFAYTGQIWLPELGMYYYKARIYSPTLGRFLQTDPIGYKDQLNLYEYVGSDPVDGKDPTGMAGDKQEFGTCGGSKPDPSCAGVSGMIESSPQSKKLIKPIENPISVSQVQKIESDIGFSEKGPSESDVKWDQPGWKLISALTAAERARFSVSYTAWNNKEDATRHAIWSIRMAGSIGEKSAKLIGDAHERSGGNGRGERTMDLINNNNARVLQSIFPNADPYNLAKYAANYGYLQTAPVEITGP